MCKIFKPIKVMVAECQKDGLHIPDKMLLGK